MAKTISKIKLLTGGAGVFILEFFYVFKKGGLNSILSYFKLFKTALNGEKIVEYENKGVLFFLIPPVPSSGFKRHLRLYTDRFILKNYNKFVGQAFSRLIANALLIAGIAVQVIHLIKNWV